VRLVGVQEVRWEKGGTERAEGCTFFYGQGNGDHRLGTGFLVHKGIKSAVRRVEFVRERHNQTHQVLRDRIRRSSTLDVRSFRGADCDTDCCLVVAEVRERDWQ
jgi:hypothetical protein